MFDLTYSDQLHSVTAVEKWHQPCIPKPLTSAIAQIETRKGTDLPARYLKVTVEWLWRDGQAATWWRLLVLCQSLFPWPSGHVFC